MGEGPMLPALITSQAYHALPNYLIPYPINIFPFNPVVNGPISTNIITPYDFFPDMLVPSPKITVGDRKVGGLDFLLETVEETTNGVGPLSC